MRTPRFRWPPLPTWLMGAAAFSLMLAAMASAVEGARTSVLRPAGPDTAASRDPIARLQVQLDRGAVQLSFDSTFGYLPAVLRALHNPVSSQAFVFSRTSLQTDKIAPWAPRALYFSDDVYIGYVQGSTILEVAAVNPNAGGVFYTLSQEPRARPAFTREGTTCLMCHQSKAATGGVAGFMVLSTITDRHGYPITGVHEGPTTDATPLPQRFGGWYVTGNAGAPGHSGNGFAKVLGHEVADKAEFRSRTSFTASSNRASLGALFDTSAYVSGQSDLVALLVLVHQTSVHNLMTTVREAGAEALRDIVWRDSIVTPALIAASPRLAYQIDRLARALVFADEAPFAAAVAGSTTFAKEFQAEGPTDPAGRTLRELELRHRLVRYPISFLVYTQSFASLPAATREAVYAKMRALLRGQEPSAALAHVDDADRRAALDILQATSPDYATFATAHP